MPSRLPPLTALRAFASAARHGSFKKAADELNVTPAAISHQLRGLEEHLGVELFRRLNRSIELTDAAKACLPKLEEGFQSLARAVDIVRSYRDASTLTVSVAPSFATRWLMPRLHRFIAAHPEVDVRIAARMRVETRPGHPADEETASAWIDDADLAIVYGHGRYPGLLVAQLLALEVTPICSPDLLRGGRPLRVPADLSQHMLLHDDTGTFFSGEAYWDIWLARAGVTGVDAGHGPHFSHAVLALEAAADGLGVVASMPALAAGELASGRLVTPFELRVALDSAYHVVCRPEAVARPAVQAFRSWLLAEASRDA